MKSKIYTANKEFKFGGVVIPQGAKFKAEWDFAKPRNSAGGKHRRLPKIETGSEESILTPFKRLQGINLSRDMLRNAPQVRGTQKTLRTNIVGDLGKLIFNANGKWFKEAQDWFNNEWAKAADFVDNTTFRETLQLIISAVFFEGDTVIVFDDGALVPEKGTGKILTFDADQIIPLNEGDFLAWKAESGDRAEYTQDSGLIRDGLGRVVGVVCSKLRGQPSCARKDALVFTSNPDDPDAANYKLVKRKFRLRQLRGVPEAFTSLETVIDGYMALNYELQTAKAGAATYANIIEPEEAPVATATGFDDSDEGPTPEEEEEEAEAEEEAYEADSLSKYCDGGLVDVFPHGTEVHFPEINRPNKDLPTFLEYTTDLAGQPFGLAHSYSRQRADTSYSSARFDMVMTWMSFKDMQQFVEDAFSDWLAKKVIVWGMENGKVSKDAPDGWEHLIAWSYPKMPEIDEGKSANARATKYRNGELTLRETLGPNWREQIDQIAEERDYMNSKGLHHPNEETVAGAIVNQDENSPEEGEDPEETNGEEENG